MKGFKFFFLFNLLFLFFVFHDVSAMQAFTGSIYNPNQSNTFTITNIDSNITYQFPPVFHDVALNTSGYVRFPISVNKVSGNSTSANVTIRGVNVTIGDTQFVCDIGTSSLNNSTFNSVTYSVMCPVNMVGGVHTIYVAFNPLQVNDNGTYRVVLGAGISYEKVDNVQVNLDTSSINNSINNQITNDNQNTQSIINNNNANTGLITGAIEDTIESQKVCTTTLIDKNNTISIGWINTSGQVVNSSSYVITDYILVDGYTDFQVLQFDNGSNSCFYNSQKLLISCSSNSSSLSVPNNAYYMRTSVRIETNKPQILIKTCKNGNQSIVDSQKETNQKLDDINNSINNDDISDFTPNATLGQIQEISNTPISDLLLMPFTILTKILDTLDSTSCSPWVLPFDFFGGNKTLTLPCINISQYLGFNLTNTIDLLFCGFMVFNIAMMIISFYESWSSLEDTFDELYTPKHVYKPKHAKE